MLSHFFESPARIHEIRNGPCGELLEGFAGYLFRNGYADITVRRHIRSAEHIVQWAGKQGLSVETTISVLVRSSYAIMKQQSIYASCPDARFPSRACVSEGAVDVEVYDVVAERAFMAKTGSDLIESLRLIGSTRIQPAKQPLVAIFCLIFASKNRVLRATFCVCRFEGRYQ